MDRLSSDLDRHVESAHLGESSAIPLPDTAQELLARSGQRLREPESLFELSELEVLYDTDRAALWTFMCPADRPSFTPSMLTDFETWQAQIATHFGPDRLPLRYLVLGSRAPGVFCFGGDLKLFREMIQQRDRDGLVAYGYRCVEILNRNIHALDLPMLTIGLVQGQALGGGFESLLSFDVMIAERGSTFGLPEISFGLFPGMGAHALLSRKLGTALADRMIMGNETYTAEQLYDMGLVHHLANPGEGVQATREFMVKADRRHAGLVNSKRAMRVCAPIALEEFYRIVDLWADAALQLREQDLKLMDRLAGAQMRLAKAG